MAEEHNRIPTNYNYLGNQPYEVRNGVARFVQPGSILSIDDAVSISEGQDLIDIPFFIFMGPTGSGKDRASDIAKKLEVADFNFRRLLACTTRSPRGEFENRYHYLGGSLDTMVGFLPDQLIASLRTISDPVMRMEKVLENGYLLEMNDFGGNFYGLFKPDMLQYMSLSRVVLHKDVGNGMEALVMSNIFSNFFRLEGYRVVPIPFFVSPVDHLSQAEIDLYLNETMRAQMLARDGKVNQQDYDERNKDCRREFDYFSKIGEFMATGFYIPNPRRLAEVDGKTEIEYVNKEFDKIVPRLIIAAARSFYKMPLSAGESGLLDVYSARKVC